MSILDPAFDEEAIEIFVKNVIDKKISPFMECAYQKSKNKLPEGTTFEMFCSCNANTNPNRSGIGQKTQIDFLKSKFNSAKKLDDRGKNCVTLSKGIGGKVYVTKGKSNINGVKSFDASYEINNELILCSLKTTDLGTFSKNIGGGHQKNVSTELKQLIMLVKNKELFFEEKKVKIHILIDGRSSNKFILECKELMKNSSTISIGRCEDL
jgi:hypothetical protein